MELELIRTYYPNGTNGEFLFNGSRVCSSIELAWKNNQHRISCIPEGRYELRKRYTAERGWHLFLANVPGRELILIHAANDANKELQGCIAPVSILTAEGKGLESRIALKKINAIVFPELDQMKQVFLTIKS
ncbi:MAG: hypothetical protein IPL84_10675 [Chitinophagaceae bacterium]|nr:hypothetical protein [Chitinophagaceae bacterium]